MKIKPVDPDLPPQGRIDDVMWFTVGGESPQYRGIGWTYPLSSPSQRFTTSNDSIRALDMQYGDLTDDEIDEWEAYALELWMRELCALFRRTPPDRTIPEGGKAAYINVNLWRSNLGYAWISSPPVGDVLPGSDSVVLGGPGPCLLTYTWGSSEPLPAAYAALFVQVRRNAPADYVQPQKLTWFANLPIVPDVELDFSAEFFAGINSFNGAYVQYGIGIGAVGSCPFEWFQIGQRLP